MSSYFYNNIVITARDPAAFQNLEPVARLALSKGQKCLFLLQGAAAQRMTLIHDTHAIWSKYPQAYATVPENVSDQEQLRHWLRSQVDAFAPNRVLTGLSSPGTFGIDEVILSETSVPTATFQDFWGVLNLFGQKKPDLVLVIDEQAQKLTESKFGIPAKIVGSPAYQSYQDLVETSIRSQTQKRRVTWFGQNLHAKEEYIWCLRDLARGIRSLSDKIELYYKPHPNETKDKISLSIRIFNDYGVHPTLIPNQTSLESIRKTDTVFSIHSNCLYDAAQWNKVNKIPQATPVSFISRPKLSEELSKECDLLELPYFKNGLSHNYLPSKAPKSDNEISDWIEEALSDEVRHACWNNSQRYLPDSYAASNRAIQAVNSLE